MARKPIRQYLIAVALLASTAGSADAGLVITTSVGDGPGARTETMLIDTTGVRQQVASHEIIFRADRQVMWMVSPEQHSYREMTQASATAMHAQMQAIMQRLPEEQRKRMEAAMGGHGQQPASYRQSGPSRQVGSWSCTPYQRTAPDEPAIDMCLARLSDLGVTHADLAPMKDMMAFAKTLAGQQTAAWDFDEMARAVGFEGLPVQSSAPSIGSIPASTRTVTKIEHVSLGPDQFDLPPGLTKQEMPGFGPPR